MTRFNEIAYDAKSHTAIVGAGLVWGDVYTALETYGVQAVGGRFKLCGVAVAGFIDNLDDGTWNYSIQLTKTTRLVIGRKLVPHQPVRLRRR
jgi:hypothetical protein